ncbi:MAG: hypothetical protein IKN75_04780 [Prevotella sp.]|nr:hypothetical protein [Prevotella sp.]
MHGIPEGWTVKTEEGVGTTVIPQQMATTPPPSLPRRHISSLKQVQHRPASSSPLATTAHRAST